MDQRIITCANNWLAVLLMLLMVIPTLVYAADTVTGQWIWSRNDAEIYNNSRKSIPDLVPCVWVSAISVTDGEIIQSLANSPSLIDGDKTVAVIVRIDDSFNMIWDQKGEDKIAVDLDLKLNKIIKIIESAGFELMEVQLDYDCPVRRLKLWSYVVKYFAVRSLKGKQIWITSIPAHIKESQYGSLFKDTVDGHIIQLFDTGIVYSRKSALTIARLIQDQSIPFRIGLGSFERRMNNEITDHMLWFSAFDIFSALPGYKGIWIFPGGKKWIHLYQDISTV